MHGSPKLPDLAQTSRVYRELLAAFFSADLPPKARERVEAAAKALSTDDQSLAAEQLRGPTISHPDWIRRSRTRGGLRARWLALFQDVDFMLCPPMPTLAFPHDHSPQLARKLDIDGAKVTQQRPECLGRHCHPERVASDDDADRPERPRLADRHADHRQLPGGPHDNRLRRADRAQFGGFVPPPI